MIEARNLGYWYGRVLALSDITMAIKPGLTGLVGPNGSGKTTFLRLASGLLKPSAGSIRVGEGAPWGDPAAARRIGLAPQGESAFLHCRGRAWIDLTLRLKGFSAADSARKTEAVLERTGAGAFAEKTILTMSRGMRQRIKLCAALAHDPETLLLDEPLTGSDPVSRVEILKLLRELAPSRTVLMSTHVLQEVEDATDEIVLLHRGRLLAQGKIQEIRDLLDRHPHAIRLGTRDPRALAALLVRETEVRSIEMTDGELALFVASPGEFFPKLTRILADGEYGITRLTSDENLEAVFRYLTQK